MQFYKFMQFFLVFFFDNHVVFLHFCFCRPSSFYIFFPILYISFCDFNLFVYLFNINILFSCEENNINISFKENATNQVIWTKIVTERDTTERNFTAFISCLVIFPFFDFIIKWFKRFSKFQVACVNNSLFFLRKKNHASFISYLI